MDTQLGERDERFDVIVIGGGQAGLSVGYHLQRKGLSFVILDASERVGDAWRKRWDSLRLFTPAWLDGLDGLAFPGPHDAFPTKDEMADYLEAYAAHFALPVRTRSKVERLWRDEDGYRVQVGERELRAAHVVIAMASFQRAHVPALGRELRADIRQLHSSAYKSPAQLQPGAVLVVGCGNSGAEIAHELSRTHSVHMAGRDVGAIPFRATSWLGKQLLLPLLMRVVFHRILTIATPIGRKALPGLANKATPLIRVRERDLERDGVQRHRERVTQARDGLPVLESGAVLDVRNVIWCTGYDASQSFIDLPIFDAAGHPAHDAGVVTSEPGLYFVGLPFVYAMSSAMVHGVGRDAERMACVIAQRRAGAAALPTKDRARDAYRTQAA